MWTEAAPVILWPKSGNSSTPRRYGEALFFVGLLTRCDSCGIFTAHGVADAELRSMPREIKEADWKVLRRVHPVALERFCARVLAEIGSVKNDDARNFHQRYLGIFEIVERSDREMARIFDDLKRSRALTMLAQMCSAGLLTDDEVSSLSPETRSVIDLLRTNG